MNTIAVDFDGVVHRYSRGWADGTIYDPPMPGALEGLRELMDAGPVFIHTTRDISDVAEWLIGRHFNVRTGHDGPFWNERGTLLVTNRKLAATAYLDDRGVRFLTWEQALRDLGMRPRLDRQPLPPETPPNPTTTAQPKGTAMPGTSTTEQPDHNRQHPGAAVTWPPGRESCGPECTEGHTYAGRCELATPTDRTVAYRSRGGYILRCLTHAPQNAEEAEHFQEVTSDDLPTGGTCTLPDCGADVLAVADRWHTDLKANAAAFARLGRAVQAAGKAGPEDFALAPAQPGDDEQLRRNLAQLQDAIARARAPHVRFDDSEHCRSDGEPWPCSTLKALSVDEGDEKCPTPLTHNWGCGCPSDEAPAADRRDRAEIAEAERDGAYRERAQLLAWIATGLPSAITPARDVDAEGWWLLFVYPHPESQLSWHIAPKDADLFAHVDHVGPDDSRVQWDGHNTPEKYERIAWLIKTTTAAQRTLKEPEEQR